MENYFVSRSGRTDTSQPSLSADHRDTHQEGSSACWRGGAVRHAEADQPKSKDKSDDIFSRMDLWKAPSESLNQRAHNELQKKRVSLSSEYATPHLIKHFEDVPHQVAGDVESKSPAMVSKFYALRNQTINAEVVRTKTTAEGDILGMAFYKVDSSTEIKIRFSIPGYLKTNISGDRHGLVQGTLRFNDNELNRLLAEQGSGIFKKAYSQKVESSPFYLVPRTIQILPYPSGLSGNQSFIFDHIKSLEGKTVIAELLRVNFNKRTGVVWYDFSTDGRTYGTPIACKLHSLPGYVNNIGETLSMESSQPIYQVTGKVKIDKERLYRVVLENCPPCFTRKTADSPHGLPVYMVNDSIKVLPSECLQKARIKTTPRGGVIIKYP